MCKLSQMGSYFGFAAASILISYLTVTALCGLAFINPMNAKTDSTITLAMHGLRLLGHRVICSDMAKWRRLLRSQIVHSSLSVVSFAHVISHPYCQRVISIPQRNYGAFAFQPHPKDYRTHF